MKEEFEFIEHDRLDFIKVFVNRLMYRAPHMHRDFEVNLILDGECTISGKGFELNLQKNDAIVLNSNTMHEIRCTNLSVKILSLQISNELLAIFNAKDIHFDEQFLRRSLDDDKYDILVNLICKVFFAYHEKSDSGVFNCLGNTALVISTILKCVPYSRLRETQFDDNAAQRITKMLSYLDDNYCNNVTLSELGEKFFIAPQYLSHFFAKNVGISFRDYISKLRFNHAVKLIDNTDNSLIDICYECGFSDYKYMQKMFVDNLGCTPKNYRKKNKPTESRAFKRTSEYIYADSEADDVVAQFINEYNIKSDD